MQGTTMMGSDKPGRRSGTGSRFVPLADNLGDEDTREVRNEDGIHVHEENAHSSPRHGFTNVKGPIKENAQVKKVTHVKQQARNMGQSNKPSA